MANEVSLTLSQTRQEIDHINEIAAKVKRSADELKEVVNECVNSGIRTRWAFELRSNLNKFNDTTMADSIALMKQQSAMIAEKAEVVETYSETKLG